MRVKRFVGNTMKETMLLVKAEFGENAIILQSRKFKEGALLGLFFGKPKIEITAAIEETPSAVDKAIAAIQSPAPIPVLSLVEKSPKLEPLVNLQLHPSQTTPPDKISFYRELQSMRRALDTLNLKIERTPRENKGTPFDTVRKRWTDLLINQEVDSRIIEDIIERAEAKLLTENQSIEDEQIETCFDEEVFDELTSLCQNTEALPLEKRTSPLVISFIGPTGVGKTTTIGKLAATLKITHQKRVALITIDTFRVAAVDQLKTFGEILDIPVDVVSSAQDIQDILHKHQDKDVIFIDTAGRSPKHELHLRELQFYLDKAQPDFNILVMSVNTQFKDQLKLIKKFEPMATHLIVTKMDETDSPGCILNLLAESPLPLLYLTNGQDVPYDIESPTPEKLKNYILGEAVK